MNACFHRIAGFLLTLLIFAPMDVWACRILPETEQIQSDIELRKELIRLVQGLAKESTHVFVARVKEIEESSEEKILDAERREFKKFYPDLNVLTSIKGSGEIDGLFWEEEQGRVIVSCRSNAHWNQISLIPTYRYLFYVRDREILRAEQIVDWPTGLTVKEEMTLIRESDDS